MLALEELRRPVRLDLSDKPPTVQEVSLAFARRIESGNVTENEADDLKKLMESMGWIVRKEGKRCP